MVQYYTVAFRDPSLVLNIYKLCFYFSDTPQGHHLMAFSLKNNGGIVNNIYENNIENSEVFKSYKKYFL